jgi:hypothetical protein
LAEDADADGMVRSKFYYQLHSLHPLSPCTCTTPLPRLPCVVGVGGPRLVQQVRGRRPRRRRRAAVRPHRLQPRLSPGINNLLSSRFLRVVVIVGFLTLCGGRSQRCLDPPVCDLDPDPNLDWFCWQVRAYSTCVDARIASFSLSSSQPLSRPRPRPVPPSSRTRPSLCPVVARGLPVPPPALHRSARRSTTWRTWSRSSWSSTPSTTGGRSSPR